MTRTLAILLLATSAQAQSPSDEPGYAFVLVTTAAPALVFDLLLAKNFYDDGLARKGFALNATIFGGVATTIGAILALTFWGDTRVKPIWTPLAVGLSVIGVGSAVLGVWGLLHVRRPPEPLPLDPPPGPFTPSPPPLPDEIPLIRVTPLFGISPGGAVMFGLSGSL